MNSIGVASHNPCVKVLTTKKVVKGEIVGPVWGGTICVGPWFVGLDAGVRMSMEETQDFSASDLKLLINRLSEIHAALFQ